jgi:hypothetical protein
MPNVDGVPATSRHSLTVMGSACDVEALLDGDGHAVERTERPAGGPSRVGRPSLGARFVEALDDHGVELRVDLLDPRDVRLDGRGRAELSPRDPRGELVRRQLPDCLAIP